MAAVVAAEEAPEGIATVDNLIKAGNASEAVGKILTNTEKSGAVLWRAGKSIANGAERMFHTHKHHHAKVVNNSVVIPRPPVPNNPLERNH